MGLYIDTKDNEKWIQQFGTKVEPEQGIKDDEMNVIVVDNISFKAYLVIYDVQEDNYIRNTFDERPKQWYVCKKADLKTVCPKWSDYV